MLGQEQRQAFMVRATPRQRVKIITGISTSAVGFLQGGGRFVHVAARLEILEVLLCMLVGFVSPEHRQTLSRVRRGAEEDCR